LPIKRWVVSSVLARRSATSLNGESSNGAAPGLEATARSSADTAGKTTGPRGLSTLHHDMPTASEASSRIGEGADDLVISIGLASQSEMEKPLSSARYDPLGK
jgi:hypothetical protein